MSLEPKIIAFCCHWCSYAAADLAGSERMRYPQNVRIIRVMCSGMVHPEMVVEAFSLGADAVMILGCRLGECHYIDGNRRALARSEMIVELLQDLGYEKEQFALHWFSAAEADALVAAITTMAQQTIERTTGRN